MLATLDGGIDGPYNEPDIFQEGNIYRWQYCGPDVDTRQYGSYHCCSRIAIVHNGLLRDTFWQIGNSFSDCRTFGPDDLSRLRLEPLGNLAELDKANESQADYYDDADIVDLNHSNHPRGNFYIRKGAQRSLKKMLAVAGHNLAHWRATENWAADRSKELQETIAKIGAGDIDAYIPPAPRS